MSSNLMVKYFIQNSSKPVKQLMGYVKVHVFSVES
jgi:hypothetical protein